jgi:hypothetical protein
MNISRLQILKPQPSGLQIRKSSAEEQYGRALFRILNLKSDKQKRQWEFETK